MNMLRSIALVAVFGSFALAACSSSDSSGGGAATGGSAGAATGGSAGAATGGSAGASTGGSAGASTGGSAGAAGGGADGGACAKGLGCNECCAQLDPTGADELLALSATCACGTAGKCVAQCADSLCANPPGQMQQSCSDCVSGACIADITAGCTSAGCKKVLACMFGCI